MNGLDYAILALLSLSILFGVLRGAIREIVNIMGWVGGFILAQSFAQDVARHFADWMQEPTVRYLLAWLAVFLAVLIVFSLIGSLIAGAVRKLGLGGLDRAGGAAIGALRGGLILLLLTLFAGLTTLPTAPIWKGSLFTPWLEAAALQAKQLLPTELAARITFGRAAI